MKRRLVIRCQWCKDESRAGSYEDLRKVYGRHLRNCGALHRMFVAGRFATGAPFTKEQVIDGILQRSGLSPEGQKIAAERELTALRQQVSEDAGLTEEERAELLASIDREIGTPTHEATGKKLAPALEDLEVDVTPPETPQLDTALELARSEEPNPPRPHFLAPSVVDALRARGVSVVEIERMGDEEAEDLLVCEEPRR